MRARVEHVPTRLRDKGLSLEHGFIRRQDQAEARERQRERAGERNQADQAAEHAEYDGLRMLARGVQRRRHPEGGEKRHHDHRRPKQAEERTEAR